MYLHIYNLINLLKSIFRLALGWEGRKRTARLCKCKLISTLLHFRLLFSLNWSVKIEDAFLKQPADGAIHIKRLFQVIFRSLTSVEKFPLHLIDPRWCITSLICFILCKILAFILYWLWIFRVRELLVLLVLVVSLAYKEKRVTWLLLC